MQIQHMYLIVYLQLFIRGLVLKQRRSVDVGLCLHWIIIL